MDHRQRSPVEVMAKDMWFVVATFLDVYDWARLCSVGIPLPDDPVLGRTYRCVDRALLALPGAWSYKSTPRWAKTVQCLHLDNCASLLREYDLRACGSLRNLVMELPDSYSSTLRIPDSLIRLVVTGISYFNNEVCVCGDSAESVRKSKLMELVVLRENLKTTWLDLPAPRKLVKYRSAVRPVVTPGTKLICVTKSSEPTSARVSTMSEPDRILHFHREFSKSTDELFGVMDDKKVDVADMVLPEGVYVASTWRRTVEDPTPVSALTMTVRQDAVDRQEA